MLLTRLTHAHEMIAAWPPDFNAERQHPPPGYATPAAFTADFKKQGAASFRTAGGYATQPLASCVQMGKNNADSLINDK
jgi:hypothetical protein